MAARGLVWTAVVAAVLLLIVAPLPLTGAGAARARANPAPRGWVAHSAYGLQLSVPKSWATEYFASCPARGSGTLLIGKPTVAAYCAFIPASADVITMEPGTSATVGRHPKDLVVNGLRVTSSSGYGVDWLIRSKNVLITATGTASTEVLRTLTVATSRAQAAPGVLMGTEYLEALEQVPVTGLVSVTRLGTHGPSIPSAHAYDGHFSDTLPPGRYLLAGQDGNVQCPSMLVTVHSGRTTVVPAIDCQGS